MNYRLIVITLSFLISSTSFAVIDPVDSFCNRLIAPYSKRVATWANSDNTVLITEENKPEHAKNFLKMFPEIKDETNFPQSIRASVDPETVYKEIPMDYAVEFVWPAAQKWAENSMSEDELFHPLVFPSPEGAEYYAAGRYQFDGKSIVIVSIHDVINEMYLMMTINADGVVVSSIPIAITESLENTEYSVRATIDPANQSLFQILYKDKSYQTSRDVTVVSTSNGLKLQPK